jgi:uncharacterized membrane protein
LVTRSPEFILSVFVLWIIFALSGLVRLITALFSQRVRNSIARHPVAHIIWLLVAMLATIILVILVVPQLSGL